MDIAGLVRILIFAPLICAVILTAMKFLPKKFETPDYTYFGISTLVSLSTFSISVILLQYVITYQGYVLEENSPVGIIQNIILYFGFYLDNLTSLFLVLLTFLFLAANIFSYKYLLCNRQGFARFYIYLNTMQFFSVCFFISSNLIQSIIFMMLSALMQYLFVNFYFQKPASQNNSKKVFQINMTGDFILLTASAAFLYFSTLAPDSINIPTLGFNNINSLGLYSFASLNPLLFIVICMLFIFGALIKSAQFPFSSKMHLSSQAPDPVFSLLVSPIVLGGGVFLLLRLYPLLNLSPVVFEVLKIIGIITAITGSLVALKENEIKNITAWAAVSQTGIAICVLGFRLYDVSVFYLLCQGITITLISYILNAVSYSTGCQENIRFLGGLREKLPVLAYPFLIGAVSLGGFIFSGFYAKASVINNLFDESAFIYLMLILATVFFTVFYIFRLYFRVFEGKYKGSYETTKPSRLMTFVIMILTVACIFFGFILNGHISGFISLGSSNTSVLPNPFVNILAFITGAAGYYLAYKIYFTGQLSSLKARALRKITKNRFYTDKFCNFIFEDLLNFISKIFSFIEKYIIGGIYLLPGLVSRFLSYFFDKYESKKINSQFFALIFSLVILLVAVIIIYFKTGAGR